MMITSKALAAQCINCSRSADATWHMANRPPNTDYELSICADCAVTILPALIADAIAARDGRRRKRSALIQASEQALVAIRASFWRAMACAGLLERNPETVEREAEHAQKERDDRVMRELDNEME